MYFCPNSADWGSVADYLVGGAVALLAWLTYRLQEAVEADRRTESRVSTSLLLLFLAEELSAIRSGMRQYLEAADIYLSIANPTPGDWEELQKRFKMLRAPMLREKLGQLATLGEKDGARLAQVAAFCWAMEGAVEHGFNEIERRTLPAALKQVLPSYIRDLDYFLDRCAELSRKLGLERHCGPAPNEGP